MAAMMLAQCRQRHRRPSRAQVERRRGRPARRTVGGESRFVTRGSVEDRGQTASVFQSPTGMTGAPVLAASRAAPVLPFSSGSKNAFLAGWCPAAGRRCPRPLEHPLGRPERSSRIAGTLHREYRRTPGRSGRRRGVEELLLAEEPRRPTLPLHHQCDCGDVEVAAVVRHEDERTAVGDVLDARDVEAGIREQLRPHEALGGVEGFNAAKGRHSGRGVEVQDGPAPQVANACRARSGLTATACPTTDSMGTSLMLSE